MNASWKHRVLALDRRVLVTLLAAGLLVVALECWLLVLRSPWSEWRSLVAQGQAPQASTEPASAADEIEQLNHSMKRIEKLLQASMAALASDEDAALSLIGALDGLGTRHGVVLGGIRPVGRGLVHGFVTTSFEIEAQGSYHALTDWLRESRAVIAPLVPIALTLDVADEDRRLTLKLKVVGYSSTASAQENP